MIHGRKWIFAEPGCSTKTWCIWPISKTWKNSGWIRIGLHLGDVLLKDGDVFGDGVNLASRLEPLSQPGGTVVSGTIKDTIQANPRFQIEPMGEVQLKNIPYRVWAFQILTPSSGNPLLRKVFKKWEGIKNTLGCELPNKIDPGCQRILTHLN